MNKKYTFIKGFAIAVSIAIGFFAKSQNIIKGKVIDAVSRQPIESASIYLSNNVQFSTVSDQYGNFILRSDNKKSDLRVTYVGYKTVTVPIESDAA